MINSYVQVKTDSAFAGYQITAFSWKGVYQERRRQPSSSSPGRKQPWVSIQEQASHPPKKAPQPS